jgi:hypothetical protein
MKNVGQRAQSFDTIIDNIVKPIINAIRLFKDIIEGTLNIKSVVQNFVRALEALPKKVCIPYNAKFLFHRVPLEYHQLIGLLFNAMVVMPLLYI